MKLLINDWGNSCFLVIVSLIKMKINDLQLSSTSLLRKEINLSQLFVLCFLSSLLKRENIIMINLEPYKAPEFFLCERTHHRQSTKTKDYWMKINEERDHLIFLFYFHVGNRENRPIFTRYNFIEKIHNKCFIKMEEIHITYLFKSVFEKRFWRKNIRWSEYFSDEIKLFFIKFCVKHEKNLE